MTCYGIRMFIPLQHTPSLKSYIFCIFDSSGKMEMLVWLFQILVLLSQTAFSSVSFSSSLHLCPPDQNLALLQFKSMISFNNCSYQGAANLLSWEERTDCCSWDGVSCDNVTGNVIGLDVSSFGLCGTLDSNSTLFLLPRLQRLNLAFNFFRLSPIPSEISRLASLTHLNLSDSGLSGSAPEEISHLSELVSLDLTLNFGLYFTATAMESLVRNLTNLRKAFLDGVNMSDVALHSLSNFSSSLVSLSLETCNLGEHHGGEFPVNIFQLPNLQFLQISFNPMMKVQFPKSNWTSPLRFLEVVNTGFSGELPDSIGGLKSLEHLELQGNFTGQLPYSIGNLVSLKWLSLAGYFTGPIPDSIGNLTQITFMDLEHNNFRGELPLSLGKLVHLSYLGLESNNFTGRIPDAFTDLTKLNSIHLQFNNFNGLLPFSLFNLTHLAYVDFSYNQLEGPIPSNVNNLSSLITLDISHNLLKGKVPSSLFVLPLLQLLSLGDNQLDGHIDEFQVKNSSQLAEIDLSNNKLHGSVPSSMFELQNLSRLSLSSNNMTVNLDLQMLSKLNYLFELDLSQNSLTLSPGSHDLTYTFPWFAILRLSSCNISEFPVFIKDSTSLEKLDLSYNKIGHIPEWFWGLGHNSLTYLNLSHNLLESFKQYPWHNLVIFDLHSNLLQGPVPAFLHSTKVVLMSDNKLSGELLPSICHMRSIEILDLSNNNLTGTIPKCSGNMNDLMTVLDLRMNNFHGTIPGKFSKCRSLKTLGLNGNQLKGSLPRSLLNCKELEVLDLGNNKIAGAFPRWLATLPKLQVLVLRSNKFQGPIVNSTSEYPFPLLRIMDISHNEFTGSLPEKYFKNFKAMMSVDQTESGLDYMGRSQYYQDNMMVTMKGRNMELVRILTTFTTIDFSNNNFSGKIPAAIGELKSLRGLNFSHNNLVESIPPSMGSLTNLEWLDLSSNELSGEIPEKLLDLTSLEVLNFSYNKLVGQIPEGRQFNTFSNDSYVGNLGLCGFPLSKRCNHNETEQSGTSFAREENVSGSKIGFGWKVVLLGYGCGVIFGLIVGNLVFSTGKPQWLVRMVGGDQIRKTKRVKNGRRRHRRSN